MVIILKTKMKNLLWLDLNSFSGTKNTQIYIKESLHLY